MYYKLVVYQSLKILLDIAQNIYYIECKRILKEFYLLERRMSLYVLRYGLALKIYHNFINLFCVR